MVTQGLTWTENQCAGYCTIGRTKAAREGEDEHSVEMSYRQGVIKSHSHSPILVVWE